MKQKEKKLFKIVKNTKPFPNHRPNIIPQTKPKKGISSLTI